MKIKFHGELSLPQFRQAVFEQLSLMEEEYFIRHMKDVTVYLTPTNGFGTEVSCIGLNGQKIKEMICHGPYQPVADEYDLS